MKKISLLCLLILIFVIFISGCSSVQFIQKPTSFHPSPGMARIDLVREEVSSYWIRMKIKDNDQIIGKIKTGETLSWDRSQGLMHLSVTPVFNTPFKNIVPFIIDVKQGHIYHIAIRGNKNPFDMGGAWSFMLISSSELARVEKIDETGVKATDRKEKSISGKVFTTEPDKNKIESLPSNTKELPKIAVWNLSPGNIPSTYAQDLTSILVSEITKLKKYEVISQENIRTVAGWTEEKMKLGCTDTKCLMALGQMDISKLISGRVGRIGSTYSVSLHLFDTQRVKADNSISEECRSEDELIALVRQTVRKLLGEEVVPPKVE